MRIYKILTASFVAATMCIGMPSCSQEEKKDEGEKSEKSEKAVEVEEGKVGVETSTIVGPLGEYYKLVDKKYAYDKGIIDHVTVELECIHPLPDGVEPCVAVHVLDPYGTVISANEPEKLYSGDIKALQQANVGDIVSIKYDNYDNVPEDRTPATIRLVSKIKDPVETNQKVAAANPIPVEDLEETDLDDAGIMYDGDDPNAYGYDMDAIY